MVTLRWQFRDGSWVIGQLLRGPEWFAEHRPQVGGKLRLDLEEMGVSGYAKVLRIEPCPTMEAGPGRVVLSTFEHSRGELYELTFENVIDTIRVTLAHPIWSEDRQSWVRAAELEPGVRVRCIGGVAVVRALLPSDTERVYNIEVDGDHCYRVGERGVLVHNQSVERLTTSHRNPADVSSLSPNERILRDRVLGPGTDAQTHLWVYRVQDGEGLGDFVFIHMGYGTRARAIALELKNPNSYSSMYNFEFADSASPQVRPAELRLLLAGICDVNGVPLPNLDRVGETELTASPMFVRVLWVDMHSHQVGLFDELNQRFRNL